jgi:hypothetical protein
MPPEPEDDVASSSPQPWELPGNFRRDCEPHRALLLFVLLGIGFGAIWLSGLGVFCVGHTSRRVPPRKQLPNSAIGVGLALMALALGASTWGLAQQDLARMRKGEVDPRGGHSTGIAALLGALLAMGSVGSLLIRIMLLGM